MLRHKRQAGFLIIEVLIAIVILSMVLLTIFSMIRTSQLRAQKSDYASEVGFLVQEGLEIASDNLKTDWSIPDGVYHPAFSVSSNKWILETGSEENLQARYKRTIEISSVCRNRATGERIAFSYGVCSGDIDPNSRMITTTVEFMKVSLGSPVSEELLLVKTI